MISNGKIVKLLNLSSSLLELHDENPFKIQALQKAISVLDKTSIKLATLSTSELVSKIGVSKGMAEKVVEIVLNGTTNELIELLSKTPEGLTQLFDIKGLGAKKVKLLWKEANIVTLEQLQLACETNQLASIKGFGEKTQSSVLENIYFLKEQEGKLHFSDAEVIAFDLQHQFATLFQTEVIISGQIARKNETISKITFLTDFAAHLVQEKLENIDQLIHNQTTSSPFRWVGTEKANGIEIEIITINKDKLVNTDFVLKADGEFLNYNLPNQKSLYQFVIGNKFKNEEEIFEKLNWQYVPAEYRESYKAAQQGAQKQVPNLVKLEDLKGNLHNHSTYSDGENTLEEMANACKNFGFEYFGIADHSKAAYWAGGLDEERVAAQQKEIEALNQKFDGFKVFKGIEADILNDGSLDYDPETLKTFDYVVASVHQNLDMDADKANARLIKAIENPFTTILGHLTGRLLLKRKGYPVNHSYIIDACAANKVVIELNASPWRLDMDWRFIDEAMNKGVLISINPDAHNTADLMDVVYGTHVARKGGLTKEFTLNALSLTEIEKYFAEKKG